MCTAPTIQVKGDVLPFCYLDEELGAFTLPSAEEILARRAVVVTCGAAGLLREAYLPAEQPATGSELPITFTHVLIDEAGQVRADSPFKGLTPNVLQPASSSLPTVLAERWIWTSLRGVVEHQQTFGPHGHSQIILRGELACSACRRCFQRRLCP